VAGAPGTATSAIADLRLDGELRGAEATVALESVKALITNGSSLTDQPQYVALFFDSELASESLFAFARDMNQKTRFVCLPLGEPGNAAGAKQLLG
jgi:hypothetical protein